MASPDGSLTLRAYFETVYRRRRFPVQTPRSRLPAWHNALARWDQILGPDRRLQYLIVPDLLLVRESLFHAPSGRIHHVQQATVRRNLRYLRNLLLAACADGLTTLDETEIERTLTLPGDGTNAQRRAKMSIESLRRRVPA